MSTYAALVKDAQGYYLLCARAERLGIITSLDDPRSPATVEALRDAVRQAEVDA